MADWVTLGNCACGSLSIFFCLNYLENAKYHPYIVASFILLPLALLFDIMDGYVARYRQNSSPYGSDLDSLADVISFSVAPAVLGFTLGLRGVWDCAILTFFVCCGVSRLARYNVTAETLAGEKKIKKRETLAAEAECSVQQQSLILTRSVVSLFLCVFIDAGTGKVKYYQGFPVPTSLALVVILAIAYWQSEWTDDDSQQQWSAHSAHLAI